MSTTVTRTELAYIILRLSALEARRCGDRTFSEISDNKADHIAEKLGIPSWEQLNHRLMVQFADYLLMDGES